MGDLKIFRILSTSVEELIGESVTVERSLQELIERNLQEILGVRLLASEYSTGQKHRGRIDTLGIDENGFPVIIEYKRAMNETVINQGLFYLDWLMDHRAEFELLVMKTLGKDVSDAITWGSPRLLCIAGDFTRYDVHAVSQMNHNIELIRYRKYADDLLLLDLVNSVESSEGAVNIGGSTKKARNGAPYKGIRDYFDSAPQSLRDLFGEAMKTMEGFGMVP